MIATATLYYPSLNPVGEASIDALVIAGFITIFVWSTVAPATSSATGQAKQRHFHAIRKLVVILLPYLLIWLAQRSVARRFLDADDYAAQAIFLGRAYLSGLAGYQFFTRPSRLHTLFITFAVAVLVSVEVYDWTFPRPFRIYDNIVMFMLGQIVVWGGWVMVNWKRYRWSLRHQRHRLNGDCVHCGYDLTGNETGVCPECGVGVMQTTTELCSPDRRK